MKDELIILDKKIILFNDTIQKYKIENEIDSLELKEQLNDILGQFEVCLKRVKLPNEYINIISAMKYANNVKKHCKKLFEYSVNTYVLYPSDSLFPSDDLFPSDFKIWWNELPLSKADFKNQYIIYNKILKGNDLPESINKVYQIIKLNYK